MEADSKRAILAAQKTAVSRKWIQKNRHRPIDFNKTWLARFEALRKNNIAPIEYTRNLKKLDSLSQGEKQFVFEKSRTLDRADFLIAPHKNQRRRGRPSLRDDNFFPQAA